MMKTLKSYVKYTIVIMPPIAKSPKHWRLPHDHHTEGRTIMKRQKEDKTPAFDIDDRGFNAKAWYLENTETSKGDALIEIRYQGELIREFLFPAYKIWNIAAHFSDIVDGELSKDNKERGYQIAASTGLEGLATP